MSDLQNDKVNSHPNERAGQATLRVRSDWGFNGSRSPYILCGELSFRIHPSICPRICKKAKKCKWLKEALADAPQIKTSGVQLELGD